MNVTNGKIHIIQAGIKTIEVGAIVITANESPMGDGVFDSAILRVAGPEMLNECLTVGGCKTSQVKITLA